MSGHLQRMAASVTRPERGVRPLVGNLFAKDDRAGESTVPGVEQDAFEESRVVRAPRRVYRGSDETKDATQRENRGPAGEREENSPLVKRQAERLVGREESAVEEMAQRNGASPAAIERIPERLVETRETVRPSETHSLLVQRPLIPERIPMDPEESGEHESAERLVIQPIVERSAVERVPALKEQQRDSRRGSEEIQIHIGRIEVIAVPAAPERPSAPAAGRRVESLDEYLQRKDRRVR